MRAHRSWGLRLAAVVLATGAPVLWASAASAQPSPSVVFTGGCASEFVGPRAVVIPEPRQTVIPAGEQVRLVNRLGTEATLRLDGEPAAELPSGATVDVRLHAGSLDVTMEIECDDDIVMATATVEIGEPPEVPAGTPPSPEPDASPSADPDTAPTDQTTPATVTPGTGAGPGAGTTDAAPEPVPASAGGDPGERPNSALALVAAACVAGVLAAAIRAFAARRPARTEWT